MKKIIGYHRPKQKKRSPVEIKFFGLYGKYPKKNELKQYLKYRRPDFYGKNKGGYLM